MGQLTIYKTDRTRPGRGADPTGRVKDLFNDRVRVAVETAGQPTVYVYFRAKETASARSEQYIAEYSASARGLSLSTAREEIERQIREWGHTLATDGSGMGPFTALGSRRGSDPPGSETERTVLRQMARERRDTVVGVADDDAALGLLDALLGDCDSMAIQQSGASTTNTDFDVYVRPGEARRGQLSYLGDDDGWEQARQRVRDEVVDQKVETVRTAVQELSTEWNMSDREIRQEVTSRVPALKSGRSGRGAGGAGGSTGKLGGSDLPFGLGRQQFAVAAVVGVVLLAAVVGGVATVLGVGPLAGGGSDGGSLTAVNVSSGEVTAGESATVFVHATEGTTGTVVLRGEAEDTEWNEGWSVSLNDSGVGNRSVTFPTEPTEVTLTAEFQNATDAESVTETVTVTPAAPSRLTVDGTDNEGVVVRTDEPTTLDVSLRDEFGNRIDRDSTVNVSVVGGGVRVADGTTETQTAMTAGTTTVDLTATTANASANVTLTTEGVQTTVPVETRLPAVSAADSRVVFRETTADGARVVANRSLAVGDDAEPVTVERDTTLQVDVQLNTDDGTPVADAAVDVNVTANRSGLSPTLSRVDRNDTVGNVTEVFRFAEPLSGDARYDVTVAFEGVANASGPVERTVPVVVTRPPVNYSASELSVSAAETEDVSLATDPTEATVDAQPNSTVRFQFDFNPDGARPPAVEARNSSSLAVNETNAGIYRVEVGDADPGATYGIDFVVGDDRAVTVTLNVTTTKTPNARASGVTISDSA